MARVEKAVLVAHSAERMVSLVEDVPAYPGFLPWCGGAEVRSREGAVTVASLTIQYRGIRQGFTTRNTRSASDRLDIALVDGPFRRLEGHWTFLPLGESGCKVALVLEYEFASRILERLIGPVFAGIADSLVDAFVARADSLDGA
ncbi:MAG: type II toxin-antitoxin system RatA family toxin [Pseudomonadota bacterium]|nr:type II toxin-antitoxin system RatA family toxin [Pseudomonadota bacterium]